MQKNTAGKWTVFAYGLPDNASDGQPITGDAANITANIRIDGGAANAVDDTNPTELDTGYYVFDITAAEANGDLLSIHPVSSTADVQVIGVPGAVWTRPPNFEALGIESDGDITKCNLVATTTTNTDMRGTDSAATEAKQDAQDAIITEARLSELDAATGGKMANQVDIIQTDTTTDIPATITTMQGNVTDILTDTGTTLPGLIDDLAVKKNATFSNFEFLMVLTSDHVTPATGLLPTGQRSIDGAAFATVSGTIAEVSNGIYQFDALAADTNGDVITWRFSAGTADDCFVTFKTVA